MLDDFLMRAAVAGIGLALITGPLGCFVVWRRMAYFGDTMAHSALLGIALAFLLKIEHLLGVFLVASVVSLALVLLQTRRSVSTDALLGILSHGALALGIVVIATMSWVRVDLMAFLFGDILAVSRFDIAIIYGAGAAILGVMFWLWRPLLAATVSSDLAEAEGLSPERLRLVFMLLMATVVALAMKIVGILLITALLIIPAATARNVTATPEQMAIAASLAGALAVIGGLSGSLHLDTPTGPSIVVAALAIFLASLLVPSTKGRSQQARRAGSS